MKPTFWDYVRAAFNARPMGMFIPPNWIGLGVFGFLGLLNPGFWIIALGLELAYLARVATDARFQKVVDGKRLLAERRQWEDRLNELVRQLPPQDQQRYRALEQRCGSILEQQLRQTTLPPGIEEQGEGLGRLVWLYLRLLLTRESIEKIVKESASREDPARMEERIGRLQIQLKELAGSDELRKSLMGQIEILQQRLGKRREAAEKLTFLDAELTRIELQVELLREQALLSTDPESLSQRIDQITTTLGGTSQWIRDQQKIYGAMEDLLTDPPPLVVPGTKESQ